MFKFAIVCIILSAISLGALIYPNFSHKMRYRKPDRALEVQYEQTDYRLSTGEIRSRIEDLVGVKMYWYKEKELSGRDGKSNIYIRRVVMDANCNQNDYIENFCHELLHLKYFTTNERFVNYKTFVTLYESEFRQVALNLAWKMQDGRIDHEYDCLAQICDYLAQ